MTERMTTISGTLEATPRGPLLHADDGLCWRVRTQHPIDTLPSPATIRGRLLDPGTIEAEYLQASPSAAQPADKA